MLMLADISNPRLFQTLLDCSDWDLDLTQVGQKKTKEWRDYLSKHTKYRWKNKEAKKAKNEGNRILVAQKVVVSPTHSTAKRHEIEYLRRRKMRERWRGKMLQKNKTKQNKTVCVWRMDQVWSSTTLWNSGNVDRKKCIARQKPRAQLSLSFPLCSSKFLSLSLSV